MICRDESEYISYKLMEFSLSKELIECVLCIKTNFFVGEWDCDYWRGGPTKSCDGEAGTSELIKSWSEGREESEIRGSMMNQRISFGSGKCGMDPTTLAFWAFELLRFHITLWSDLSLSLSLSSAFVALCAVCLSFLRRFFLSLINLRP